MAIWYDKASANLITSLFSEEHRIDANNASLSLRPFYGDWSTPICGRDRLAPGEGGGGELKQLNFW